MPQTRSPSRQGAGLAGDLEHDLVAQAVKRYDLDPDATTEVP
jgi:hypothetical protein